MDAPHIPAIVRDIQEYVRNWHKGDYPGKHSSGPQPMIAPRIGVTEVDEGGIHINVQVGSRGNLGG